MFALAVIVGSVREGRFGPVVADWFVGQAKQRDGVSVDVIDLADTPIPSANFASRIGTADAREPDAVNAAAGALLDQLAWWAHTLRHARAAHPYGTYRGRDQ
jgi:NAD(P)H-dependent FMN reductase